MKLRVVAVCTLLLLSAVPSSFAAPLCEDCDYFNNSCDVVPGAIDRCAFDEHGCYIYFEYCWPPRFAEATVTSGWKIASIEISRPAQDSITVTAPATVAAVRAPRPAAQK